MNLSVVIPVYNEEAGLAALFARLYPALDALGKGYEIIFVNDGSRDRSAALLREQFAKRPDVTRVVLLNGNFGQHMAIMAGFERVRGERIVTLDADLQNPPEEIGKLLKKMDEGYDYVGTIRRSRRDVWWRKAASRMMNRLRERITRVNTVPSPTPASNTRMAGGLGRRLSSSWAMRPAATHFSEQVLTNIRYF